MKEWSEIQLHIAQLLNSSSIYNSVMIKVSKTELNIQYSRLKLTSVARFPSRVHLWFETETGTRNWLTDFTAYNTGKTG